MSTTHKILVVFGATGVQGGSVVTHVLADPVLSKTYHIRGITRDVTKPAAKALAAKGVELHTADLDDKASVAAVVAGADTVFLVTNYWELHSGAKELAQGKLVADACREAGVAHFIPSTLMSVKEMSKGKYSAVDHFESKAQIEAYTRAIGIPATFVLPGFYASNCKFRTVEDGSHVLSFNGAPDAKFPILATAEDFGKFVVGAMRNRDRALGMNMLASGGYFTGPEVAAAYAEANGVKAAYVPVPDAVILKILGGNEELLQNFQMMFDPECGYYGHAALEPTLELLVEKPLTMVEYFKAQAGK